MKLLKRKNFQALIYAIFISLPMLSILPSTIYFAFNHEASNYTQNEVIETYEYETNEVNSVDDLVVGNIYKFTLPSLSDSDYSDENLTFQTDSNFVRLIYGQFTTDINTELNDIHIELEWYFDDYSSLWVAYTSNIQYDDFGRIIMYFVYQEQTTFYTTNFSVFCEASDYLGEKNVQVIESEMNPMSAFDNAIGKFVSDNDFGRLDFFTFFSSLFLSSSSMNNLYIHFINWYMNYALYVSLAYLLFAVLLYFVNFFRKLVENSEDTHIGGF